MAENLHKILIVDDEEHIRESGGRVLRRRLKADISTVSDGLDAIKMIQTINYSLVLLDLNIPGCNGWTVLSEVRRLNKEVKILIITGFLDLTEEHQLIVKRETSGLLHKDGNIQTLVKKIAEILGEDIVLDSINLKPDNLKGRPEAREIVHALNGVVGSVRISCDEYFYLKEHGQFNNLPIEKSALFSLDSIRGTIFDPLKKESIWEQVAEDRVMLKQGVAKKIEDIFPFLSTNDANKFKDMVSEAKSRAKDDQIVYLETILEDTIDNNKRAYKIIEKIRTL